MKPRNRLSDLQRVQFDERMRHWQAVLGLLDWRVEPRAKVAKRCMACVTIDYEARLATYQTGDFGGTPITDASIDATARHEMLHVLLAEFGHISASTDDEALQASAEHRVVNLLEKLLEGLA